jgi:hypothetical protein
MQITRPERIKVGNATMTVRNPVALWILTLLTLGIWGVVWAYQVSRELRDYSEAVTRPFQNFPVLTALLVALYPIALIPGILAAYMISRRVRTVQEWTETPGRVVPILGALLFVVLFAHIIYVQRGLNDAWAGAKAGRGPEPDYAVASGHAEEVARRARDQGQSGRWA